MGKYIVLIWFCAGLSAAHAETIYLTLPKVQDELTAALVRGQPVMLSEDGGKVTMTLITNDGSRELSGERDLIDDTDPCVKTYALTFLDNDLGITHGQYGLAVASCGHPSLKLVWLDANSKPFATQFPPFEGQISRR